MASGLPAQPPPGQGREIHFAGGSFICGTIKARGRDPCRRRESDLPADGFIISQAQQFGLNETKPLLLMKTPLMSGASEGEGGGGSANGVSAVLRAGATAWCPNHEAKAGGSAPCGPGTARGGPSSRAAPRGMRLKEQIPPHGVSGHVGQDPHTLAEVATAHELCSGICGNQMPTKATNFLPINPGPRIPHGPRPASGCGDSAAAAEASVLAPPPAKSSIAPGAHLCPSCWGSPSHLPAGRAPQELGLPLGKATEPRERQSLGVEELRTSQDSKEG